MKFNQQWLTEWVNPLLTTTGLLNRLTMAGLEVEETNLVYAPGLRGLTVGKILQIQSHPSREQLNICQVNVGQKQLTIVTAAPNIKSGMCVIVAEPNAQVAHGKIIQETEFAGIISQGMLCSQAELGLCEQSSEIWELPADLIPGTALEQILNLNDEAITLNITPNRGDCLSMLGIAREVALLTAQTFHLPVIPSISVTNNHQISINVQAPEACPQYATRVIRCINSQAITPLWIQERLLACGIRAISPVVDVTNYVMLELGQPLHAFDLKKLSGSLYVRFAHANERLTLLNQQTVELTPDTLIISDDKTPQAIAGIMGGASSSIESETSDIVLESAYFNPTIIAGRARHYNALTDSAYRFERGIDPTMQIHALERATELLLSIVGGEAGPINAFNYSNIDLKMPRKIKVRHEKIIKLLGFALTHSEIEAIFSRLAICIERQADNYIVHVPSARNDLMIEEDLIEEVARIYGYENIPSKMPEMILSSDDSSLTYQKLKATDFAQCLMNHGYHEAITYSFVDPALQKLINPQQRALPLKNPISADMAVMRFSLWPGLIGALQHNLSRQQNRVRLFETGLCFILQDDDKAERVLVQKPMIGGLISGDAYPLQWARDTNREVDFFDIKQHAIHLLHLAHVTQTEFSFMAKTHPALHPGQSAAIMRGQQYIGWIGMLHPAIQKQLDIVQKVFLFELSLDDINQISLPIFNPLSKFPSIKRDISFLIAKNVPVSALLNEVQQHAKELLQSVNVFDIYQGKNIAPDQKSIALTITLQHSSRTLIDEEINSCMNQIINALKNRYQIILRES